jgi:hypothetical protein
MALETVQAWMADNEANEDEAGDITTAIGDVQDVIDRAEGVTFPGMYG